MVDEIQGNYPEVDSLIYNAKKTFVKARLRVEKLKKKASSTIFVKELFSSDVSGNLTYMKSNFEVIKKKTAQLEAVGMEMNDVLYVVRSDERTLEQSCGKAAEM